MLNAIVWLVVGASAVGVYLDAASNRIGKIEGDKSFTNMSAGSWGICVLFLWLIGLPLYIAKRSSLLARAAEHPRESDMRPAKAGALAAGPAAMAALILATGGLPECGSEPVTGLLRQIFAQTVPGVSVRMESHGEVEAESSSARRVCRMKATTPLGEEWIRYSIEPHEGGQIFVRVIGQ